mmetsp:Transcript_66426/g.205686  ORF Transcript_66426/g.205686 Transcript_66426/m.205686 type:complete len:239 (+) Transcript_66426:595-1311(+)
MALSCMAVGIWVRAPQLSAQRAAPVSMVNRLEAMPAVLCIGVYAFMWHTNCVTVARELRDPTRKRCLAVALASTVLLYTVYAAIAVGGYLSWGDGLAESRSVVAMYAKDDVLFMAIRVLLSVAMIITTAINVYPLRESCMGLAAGLLGHRIGSNTLSHAVWAGVLVAVAAVLAIEFPDVVALITLLGGTLATCMMFVFPSVIAKMVLGPRAWRAAAAVLSALAAVLVLAGFGLIGQPA